MIVFSLFCLAMTMSKRQVTYWENPKEGLVTINFPVRGFLTTMKSSSGFSGSHAFSCGLSVATNKGGLLPSG